MLTRLKRLYGSLNAFTLRYDEALLDELRQACFRDLAFLRHRQNAFVFAGGQRFHQPLAPTDGAYYLVTYQNSPLLWISANRPESFARFARFFAALGIGDDLLQLTDCASQIRLYSCFYLIGTHMPDCIWHVDYRPGANGFTLITPLLDVEPDHGRLLYKPDGEAVRTYAYSRGEAIVFGDRFMHGTEPYPANGRLRVLVSLAFGTDKPAYWPLLRQTLELQCQYLFKPCGHLVASCECS